jgi:hypothetical protein
MTGELESAEGFVLALGGVIEARDPGTEGHCERAWTVAGRVDVRPRTRVRPIGSRGKNRYRPTVRRTLRP